MECWFWNIDPGAQEYFSSELNKGVLRQGWGYDERLDLRKLKTKTDNNIPFDDEEQRAWDRCNTMLIYINEGDLVVVKNVPTWEQFTIVKIKGGYNYSIEDIGDYGHMLPVIIVNTFHKYSKVVPSPFINALNREQNPIRITYKHSQTVRELASIIPSSEEKDKPELFKDKVISWRESLFPTLKESLKRNLTASETERLILEMLRRDGLDVLWNAGAYEKGADILCDVQLGYGLLSKIAIQVKMHWGEDYDITGIEQLEKAFEAHSVQAGLLVSMAEKLGDNVIKRIEKAKKKYNIQVLYGEQLYGRLLELIADSSLDFHKMP